MVEDMVGVGVIENEWIVVFDLEGFGYNLFVSLLEDLSFLVMC